MRNTVRAYRFEITKVDKMDTKANEMFKSNEVPDFYRVKCFYRHEPQNVLFGIVNSHSDEQKKRWKTHRQLIVEDAVTGKTWHCPAADMVFEEQKWEDGNEYDAYVEKEYKKAVKLDKKVGKGVKIGKLFRMGVGDGYAFYVITSVTGNKVKVEWRSFQGDRWVDQMFGYGGSFRKKDVANMVGREDALQEIFGNR